MDADIQIMICKFPNAQLAELALKKVRDAKQNQGVEVKDAAVVRRDEHGKLYIHETEDVTGGRGATVGGILGGVLGILAGPGGIIVGAAIGAVVGGAAAGLVDTGIPHKRLEEIGASLKPDGAALVVLTEAGFVPFLETVIAGDGVEIHTDVITAASAEKLAHDHEVAVQALAMGEALADGGMASPSESEPKAP